MLIRLFSLIQIIILILFLSGCASQNTSLIMLPAEEVQEIKQIYSKEIASMRNMIVELPPVFSDIEYRKKWINKKRIELESNSFYHLHASHEGIGLPVIQHPEGWLGSDYMGAHIVNETL